MTENIKPLVRSALRKITTYHMTKSSLKMLGQAGILPDIIWKRLPIEGTFEVTLPHGKKFQYKSVVEEGIGRALFWQGWDGYEPEVVSVFCNLARKSKVVIDVGAHTGLYTLLACTANAEANVICFEPVPFIYNRLKDHILMNKLEKRCELRKEAVSNMAGNAILHVPFGDQPVSASLHSDGFITHSGSQIDVPITSIDTVCSSYDAVDLVKIDAEGFEDKVLEGMEKTITRFHPWIIIECMPDGPFKKVNRLLRDYGYRIFHLNRMGITPITSIEPHYNRQYPNYLCSIADIPEGLN